MRCIPLQWMFFLLYNATLFVLITSCSAEILALWGGGVRKEIWVQQNNPQWYWLKLSSRVPYWFGWMVVFLPMPFQWLSPDLTHFFPDRTTSWRHYLSSKTGYGNKWGSIVKQKEHALQWYAINTIQYNTIHLISK